MLTIAFGIVLGVFLLWLIPIIFGILFSKLFWYIVGFILVLLIGLIGIVSILMPDQDTKTLGYWFMGIFFLIGIPLGLWMEKKDKKST